MNLLYCLLLLLVSSNHDYHVSNCQINYDTDDQSLQIVLHTFLDDLEDAIKLSDSTGTLHLLTELETSDADSLVEAYLDRHLQIVIENTPVALKYIGKETAEDFMAGYFYIEVPLEARPQSIQISNHMYFDLFDDQIHIIQCAIDGQNDQLYMGTEKRPTLHWEPSKK